MMTKPELQALARQCGMEWVNDVLCYFSYTNLQRFYEAVVARERAAKTLADLHDPDETPSRD